MIALWTKQKGLQGLAQDAHVKRERAVELKDINKKLFPKKKGLMNLDASTAALGILRSKFLIPPFSVLNAREGDWQNRKRAWLRLGIQSELGRAANLQPMAAEDLGPNLNNYRDEKKKGKGALADSKSALELAGGFEDHPSHKETFDKAKRKQQAQASPGGSPRPAMDYSKNERGAGNGKPLAKTYHIGEWMEEKAGGDRGAKNNQPAKKRTRKANAMPSGGGGGGWKALNESMTKNRAEMQGVEIDPDAEPTGTSIFDPVLTELIIRWFSPEGGKVLDPFAGGSVRGIVSSILGRHYTGIDLRQNQLDANVVQAERICKGYPMPRWIQGDSLNIRELIQEKFDAILTCPPYGDLERYSDDPQDLSAMSWPEFRAAYYQIIFESCQLLRNNRFACFVVGDFRGEDGNYRNFVSETIRAFMKAGLTLYNEAVLVTAVGSLPIRVTKQFETSRKLGKTHQQLLVFLKGDARAAASRING